MNWKQQVNKAINGCQWIPVDKDIAIHIHDVDVVSDQVGEVIYQYQQNNPDDSFSMQHIVWEDGVLITELGEGGEKYLFCNNTFYTTGIISVEVKELITSVISILTRR